MFFAIKFDVNKKLLLAAALLHDIDKAASRLAGERHPDAAVRILREEGMGEVADLVATHPLHAILDPSISPKTWEQKLLYLSDKMVKYDIVGVDTRFALWNAEKLPPEEQKILDRSYPKVKALEQEVFKTLGITLQEVVKLA
jgi:putative nucleotidyltransferase with HDIG domain